MSIIKPRVADAAVELVGREGIHGLTHARVDAAAGVPRGSTSNYFRSRAALLDGVVTRLEELDRVAWSAFYDVEIPSVDALVEALAGFVEYAVGAGRTRTIARYALFVESMFNDDVRDQLARGRELIEQWAQRVVTDLGASDPAAAMTTILAYLDGLILHGLALPADPELRPGLRTVVVAALD